MSFSGVVEQIGSEVAACALGDAVFGTTSGMDACTEYLAVNAAAVATKPSNLTFEEAASIIRTPETVSGSAERSRSRMKRTTVKHKQKEIESWSASLS